jgi:hypothetical protein
MSWTVLSDRLPWPAGTTLATDDLAGCNIDALVKAGHLAKATPEPRPQADKAAQED